jgi:hypothetical protein
MFGGFGAHRAMQQYRDGKRAHATLPHRDVSEAEFINLAVAAGIEQKDAEQRARTCRIMGSSTQIGDETLSVIAPTGSGEAR